MPRTSFKDLVDSIKRDHPDISLTETDESFSWSPSTQTIFYNTSDPYGPQVLLHELGHAIKNHSEYQSDIHLIRMEREAWQEAVKLSGKYSVRIDQDFIEDNLDSYRDWIYKKSTCPSCSSTGFQENKGTYRCPACKGRWRVNQGITCRIYRSKND